MFKDFFEAWWFLKHHKIFFSHIKSHKRIIAVSRFQECLDISAHYVDPDTRQVEDDNSRNTQLEIWLECGPWSHEHGTPTGDYDLDCGADTFEAAIIALAELVLAKYGEYRDEWQLAMTRREARA